MKDYISVFLSSKQSEFEVERAVLADKIKSIPFLAPVLAEEWHSEHRSIQEVFLDDVRQAPIYVGLFHRIYNEPTELEYRAAVKNPYREILIYLKNSSATERDPILGELIQEFTQTHVVTQFTSIGDLLPLFTNHLRSALSRMILHLQKLGEEIPQSRSANSALAKKWARQRQYLLDLGLPGEVDSIAKWTQRLSDALNDF